MKTTVLRETAPISNARTLLRLSLRLSVAGVAILFAFVYAYPAIFRALDGARPDRFQARVDTALANDRADHAVVIAREAARWRPLDPMAHTTLGRALIADGNTKAAETALRAAVAVPTTPAPEYRPTRRTYFFAPARLSLAQLAHARGDTAAALHELLLASAYDDIAASQSGEFGTLAAEVFRAHALTEPARGATWAGVNAMQDGAAIAPAWIDTARDWYALRDDSSCRVVKRDGRSALVIRNDDIHRWAVFYSTPLYLDSPRALLLEGELFAPETPAVLSWQALDAGERVAGEGWLFDQERTPDWERRSLTIPANPFYYEVRIILGVTRHTGEATFANVQLAEVNK